MKSDCLTEKVVRISARLNRRIQEGHQQPLLPLKSKPFDGPIYSYVIFKESDFDYWCKPFLKKEFTHVFLIQKHEFGWIMLNPTQGFLHVDIMDFQITDDVAYVISQIIRGVKILEVVTRLQEPLTHFGRPKSCVSIVNYCLGLRWMPFSCMTPYQLYNKLLKANHPNIISTQEIV